MNHQHHELIPTLKELQDLPNNRHIDPMAALGVSAVLVAESPTGHARAHIVERSGVQHDTGVRFLRLLAMRKCVTYRTAGEHNELGVGASAYLYTAQPCLVDVVSQGNALLIDLVRCYLPTPVSRTEARDDIITEFLASHSDAAINANFKSGASGESMLYKAICTFAQRRNFEAIGYNLRQIVNGEVYLDYQSGAA